MKKIIKKMIKKSNNLYFSLYKFYIPLKIFQNKNKYKKHFDNFLNDVNTPNKKIFFIGIPLHNNLGDQAQYYCIKKYLNENYSDYTIIEIIDDLIFLNFNNIIAELKKNITNEDFFVFQSGYRTTDVSNFGGEYAHQSILKNFNNKIIVFPQTVNFHNKTQKKNSEKAYNSNNNYIFLARDKLSFSIAKDMYDERRVFLYPDIVTTLIGNCPFLDTDNKDGILLCLRNDEEKYYSDSKYIELIEKLKSLTNVIDRTDTNSLKDFEFDKSIVEEEIIKKLKQFSKYKLVITDRYHGTIFSLIAKCNVIVLNSTDHKLSSGVEWFNNVIDENIKFCKNFDEVLDLAKKMYYYEWKNKDDVYFKRHYYDKLKDLIDNETK